MRTVRARLHDDEGSIVFGWLGRLALTLTVMGIICFEVLSIVVTHVSLEDIGMTAGDKALTSYQQNKDPNQAFLAADAYASEQGAQLVKKSFSITPDSVSFELTKTAPTLLLYRWGRTAEFAEVHTQIYEEPFVQSGSMP